MTAVSATASESARFCRQCRPPRRRPAARAVRASSRPPTRSTSATTSARCGSGSTLQDDHDAFYCVVDLHAITVEHDPALLRERTLRSAAQLLAMGLDPERARCSSSRHVPEHAQLAWVLGCLTGFGEASRMTQFKDKSAQGRRRPADGRAVHLPDPAGRRHPALPGRPRAGRRGPAPAPRADPRPRRPVQPPVRRHVRAARAAHPQGRPRRSSTSQDPTAKMSKSASSPAGIVELLDDPRRSAKKIRSAVTDSGREIRFDEENKPGVSNLLTIYSALTGRPIDDLVAGVRRPGLRRPQEGPRPRSSTTSSRRSGSGRSSCSTTGPSSTRSCVEGAERARDGRRRRPWPRVYDRVGLRRPSR